METKRKMLDKTPAPKVGKKPPWHRPSVLQWLKDLTKGPACEFRRETLPVFWRKERRLIGCRASWMGETRNRNARQGAETLRRFVEGTRVKMLPKVQLIAASTADETVP
jgi:hypothetical protein